MQAFIWISTAIVVALWSLVCWGLHSLLLLDPSWIGGIKPWLEQIPFGPWLEQWLPGWQALMNSLLDLAQAMLRWLGMSAGLVVGLLWAGGSLLLLAGAGLLSLIVALLNKDSAAPAPPPPLRPLA